MFCGDANECTGKVRGIVTARGGDRVDWYSIQIPSSACYEDLTVDLRWIIPREGSELALTGPPEGSRRYFIYKRHVDHEGKPVQLRWQDTVGPGTYVFGVHARGASDAGDYTLHVSDRSRCNPSPQLADIYVPRPDGLAPPPTHEPGILAEITSAGMARRDQGDVPANHPTLVIDASNPRIVTGVQGVLVDARGKPVHHGAIEIVDTWSVGCASPSEGTGPRVVDNEAFGPREPACVGGTRFASARFREPGWFRRTIENGWNHWFVFLPTQRRCRNC